VRVSGARGSRCYFPDDWKGQYFQSGLGNVIIRKSVITTKGTCVDQHRDYFLFANRSTPPPTLLIFIYINLSIYFFTWNSTAVAEASTSSARAMAIVPKLVRKDHA